MRTEFTRGALCALVLTLLAPPAFGHGGHAHYSEAELRAMRDKRLAEGWVKAQAWILDYDQARARAQETRKPIFACFTRTVAPADEGLVTGPFSSPAFGEFAEGVVLFLHLTTGLPGEKTIKWVSS